MEFTTEQRVKILEDQNIVNSKLMERLEENQQEFHADVFAWINHAQSLMGQNQARMAMLEDQFSRWLKGQEGNGKH